MAMLEVCKILLLCVLGALFDGVESYVLPGLLNSNGLPHIPIQQPYDNTHQYNDYSRSDLEVGVLPEDESFFEDYADLMSHYIFPRSAYVNYFGDDSTSLYGTAVHLSDEFAVVGGNGYNDLEGVVKVYQPQGLSEWSLLTTIASPIQDIGGFGCAVDQDDSTGDIIIGAKAFNLYTGQVYVYSFFDSDHTSWSLNGVLTSPEGQTYGFGSAVAISGNYSIVSTTKDQAYIYERRNSTWTLVSSLTSPDVNKPLREHQHFADNVTHFGHSVSIQGEYAVVGSYLMNETYGAVYVYGRDSNGNWSLDTTLTATEGANSYFGWSTDMHGDTLIVGAIGNRPDISQTNSIDISNHGWAYIYELMNMTSGPVWSLTSELQSPVGENVYFGHSVKLSAKNAMVSAIAFNDGAGAAFVYSRTTRDNSTAEFPLSSAEGFKSTYKPSRSPTLAPTRRPTVVPTTSLPSMSPSVSPSERPSEAPTLGPSQAPSMEPTEVPTSRPSISIPPSESPTFGPTHFTQPPTETPSEAPTHQPTVGPTLAPSQPPSVSPTHAPTLSPSAAPSAAPSEAPSVAPSDAPTAIPTEAPTLAPSTSPTRAPSQAPSGAPTNAPSDAPTHAPSDVPTHTPSLAPTNPPTPSPSDSPSFAPTAVPSIAPSFDPSMEPSFFPSSLPSLTIPATTGAPSEAPSVFSGRRLAASTSLKTELLPNDSLWHPSSFLDEYVPAAAFAEQQQEQDRQMLQTPAEEAASNSVWVLNISLPAPIKYGAFGYAVGVSDNYFAIGADNYTYMQGAVYIGGLHAKGTYAPTSSPTPRATNATPTSQPTSQPSGQPTSAPSRPGGLNSVNSVFLKSKKKDKLGLWIAIALAVFVALLLALLAAFCCCVCCAPIPLAGGKKKKKKKKEEGEEDSPYTIHGPGGELWTEESQYAETVDDIYNRYLREEEDEEDESSIGGSSRYSTTRYGVRAVPVEELDKDALYSDEAVVAEPMPKTRMEAFREYTDRALRKMNLLPADKAAVGATPVRAMNRAEALADYDAAAMAKIRQFENQTTARQTFNRRALLQDYDDAAMQKIREFDRQAALEGRQPPRRTTSLGSSLNEQGSSTNVATTTRVSVTAQSSPHEREFLQYSEGLVAEQEFFADRDAASKSSSKLSSLIRNAKLRGMVAKAKYDKIRGKSGDYAKAAALAGDDSLTSDRGAVFHHSTSQASQSDAAVEQISLVEKSRQRYAEIRRRAAEHTAKEQAAAIVAARQANPPPHTSRDPAKMAAYEEHNRHELALRHAEEERLRSLPVRGAPLTINTAASAPSSRAATPSGRGSGVSPPSLLSPSPPSLLLPTSPPHPRDRFRPADARDETSPASPPKARSSWSERREAHRLNLGSVSDDSEEDVRDMFFASPHQRRRANSVSSSSSGSNTATGSKASYASSSESSNYRPQQFDLMKLSQRHIIASSGVFDALEGGAPMPTAGAASQSAPPTPSPYAPAATTAPHRSLGAAVAANREFNSSSIFQQQAAALDSQNQQVQQQQQQATIDSSLSAIESIRLRFRSTSQRMAADSAPIPGSRSIDVAEEMPNPGAGRRAAAVDSSDSSSAEGGAEQQSQQQRRRW